MREVRASSSRPRVHDRSTSSEQEIFAATERLLSKVSARYLSVEIPLLRTMGLTALDRIRDGIAAEIDRERAAGLAPPGPDSRQLVATLLWATANCLYIAGLDDIEDLPSETEISESIVALWLRTLYEAERSDLARGLQHQDGHDPVPNEEDRGRHVDGHQAVVRERPGLEEQG
jgi:EthR-like transcriptional regulator